MKQTILKLLLYINSILLIAYMGLTCILMLQRHSLPTRIKTEY